MLHNICFQVLRKKYYNMVEDMKGKIRVYCRSRPLSSDELNRVSSSVLQIMRVGVTGIILG